MARLFIIGNGFDVAHGYRTKYCHFRDWILFRLAEMGISEDKLDEIPEIPFSFMGHHDIEYNQDELLKMLMWLLQYGSPIDDEWNKFESALYELDIQAVLDEAAMFIDDGLDDNDTISGRRSDDRMYHAELDYQMYAEELRNALYMIKELFSKWINTVDIGHEKIAFGWETICNKGQGVSSDDIFISFNYTETLEQVYGVPESQVFHLHGYRKKGDELIVGHGIKESRGFNTKYILAADLLEEGIRNLRKDTDSIIRNNGELWDLIRKSDISDVYSFGFSFSEVDLPYISRISWLLHDKKGITWHLSSRDHGKTNDRNIKNIQKCGYTGDFEEYNSSKKVLYVSSIIPALLDQFDRKEKVHFFYDESNFFGKFYMKNQGGCFDFNACIDKDFVLAGIVTEDDDLKIDKDELWKLLGLGKDVKEIKFKNQISEGDFLSTLHRMRLVNLLDYIDTKGMYIHVADVNVFYYAIVDIIDSIMSGDALEDYAADEFSGDLRYANDHLKQLLYKTLHERADDTANLFARYGYPEIEKSEIADFCDDLVEIFGERWTLRTELKYVSGMIKAAGRGNELLYLSGNERFIMLDKMAKFYMHFIALFPKADHTFDNQGEVKRWLEEYIILDDTDNKLENYRFQDSKDELLIQLSDVVSGICGQMFEYLNVTKNHTIWKDVQNMDDQQLQSASKLCSLYYKSSARNEGFIFSITAQENREKFKYFADMVIRENCRREQKAVDADGGIIAE